MVKNVLAKRERARRRNAGSVDMRDSIVVQAYAGDGYSFEVGDKVRIIPGMLKDGDESLVQVMRPEANDGLMHSLVCRASEYIPADFLRPADSYSASKAEDDGGGDWGNSMSEADGL